MQSSTTAGVGGGRRSRRALELAAWILFFFVARGLLVLSFADVFGYGEEMEKACAGKAMLDGLGVPHHQLAYHDYEGGGFVVSHLDALAFLALGQSLLAVKLVALALGACVLAAGWSLCERFGGAAASRAFGLLFVFAPESVQKNSLLALGIHFEACLFIALILFFAGCAIAERGRWASTWLALGLSAGFGLYFSYQCALTIAVAAVALVWTLRRDCLSRRTLIGALGFVVGLAPMLWMASKVGGEVFDIHGAELVGGASKLDKLGAFASSVFAGRSEADLVALIALCASPLLGVLALRRAAPAPMRMATWLVLAYALVFLAAYLASGFTVGRVYHYFLLHRLTPLWFAAALLTSFGVAAAMRLGHRMRRLALGAVAVLALCGAVDTIRMVRDAAPLQIAEHASLLAHTKGYAYPEYLQKIAGHLGGPRSDQLAVMLRFREEDPPLLHEGIAIALYGDGRASLDEMRAEVRAAGVTDASDFVRGFGNALRSRLGGDIVSRAKAIENEPAETRELLLEAIGRSGDRLLATEDRVRREIQLATDAQLGPSVLRGLGSRLHNTRGDLTIPHYFEMRHGPLALDRDRAYDIAGFPFAASLDLISGYDAAHRRHYLDGVARDE